MQYAHMPTEFMKYDVKKIETLDSQFTIDFKDRREYDKYNHDDVNLGIS